MQSPEKAGRRRSGEDSAISGALGALRADLPAVPSGLVDDILSYVFEGGTELHHERRVRLWWFVTAGVVAAMLGGAAAGVAIRWRQGRLAGDIDRLRRVLV